MTIAPFIANAPDGLFAYILMYLISQFILKPYVFGAEGYPHFLHIMGILFVINIGIMLLVGKLQPKTEVYVPKVTEEIDITPWKHAKTVGIIIALLVLSTYFIFR